jgi:hypothetical protein
LFQILTLLFSLRYSLGFKPSVAARFIGAAETVQIAHPYPFNLGPQASLLAAN